MNFNRIAAICLLAAATGISDAGAALTDTAEREAVIARQLDCVSRSIQSGQWEGRENQCASSVLDTRFELAAADSQSLAVELTEDGAVKVNSGNKTKASSETSDQTSADAPSPQAPKKDFSQRKMIELKPIPPVKGILIEPKSEPADPADSEKYPSIQVIYDKHTEEFHTDDLPHINTIADEQNKFMKGDKYQDWNTIHNKHKKMMEEDKYDLKKFVDEEGSGPFDPNGTDGGLARAPHNGFHMGDFLYDAFDRDNPLTKWELGGEFSMIKYEEPDFMKQEGAMYGVFGAYTHRFRENDQVHSWKDVFSTDSSINLFKADVKFSMGEVDYESNGTGTIDGIDDYMIETRGVFGYDFPYTSRWLFTPYMGFGYRYLNDDSGGRMSTTGHFGYEREANYFYLPLGIDVGLTAAAGWSLGLTFEYDVFLKGKQKSHLEDVHPSLNTVENDQSDGYGLRGSIKLTKEFDAVDFVVEPFIRYWNIDDSNVSIVTSNNVPIGAGLEPANESTEYGLKVGLRY